MSKLDDSAADFAEDGRGDLSGVGSQELAGAVLGADQDAAVRGHSWGVEAYAALFCLCCLEEAGCGDHVGDGDVIGDDEDVDVVEDGRIWEEVSEKGVDEGVGAGGAEVHLG